MTPQAIFLDFDGVILESVAVKSDAFREMFSHVPEHVEAIVAMHERLGGISRYEKFEMIYRDFLDLPLSDDEKHRLGNDFKRHVFEKVLTCPMVLGAQAFLTDWLDRCPLFVVSGTPEEELKKIVECRNLSHFFKGIYGSPRTKPEIVETLLDQNDLDRRKCLFVGDALSDHMAAQETDLHFIARIITGQPDLFPKETLRISDLRSLSAQIDLI